MSDWTHCYICMGLQPCRVYLYTCNTISIVRHPGNILYLLEVMIHCVSTLPLYCFIIINKIVLCCRCESLAEVNQMLRDQIAQANDANNVLSDDLQKVTEDWNEAKETLAKQEAEWKEEKEALMVR